MAEFQVGEFVQLVGTHLYEGDNYEHREAAPNAIGRVIPANGHRSSSRATHVQWITPGCIGTSNVDNVCLRRVPPTFSNLNAVEAYLNE